MHTHDILEAIWNYYPLFNDWFVKGGEGVAHECKSEFLWRKVVLDTELGADS